MPVTVSGAIESIKATTSSPADLVAALRGVHAFADLPEDQLKWFADNVRERRYAARDLLFRRGDPPDWLVVFLEGEMHATGNNVHDLSILREPATPPAK